MPRIIKVIHVLFFFFVTVLSYEYIIILNALSSNLFCYCQACLLGSFVSSSVHCFIVFDIYPILKMHFCCNHRISNNGFRTSKERRNWNVFGSIHNSVLFERTEHPFSRARRMIRVLKWYFIAEADKSHMLCDYLHYSPKGTHLKSRLNVNVRDMVWRHWIWK